MNSGSEWSNPEMIPEEKVAFTHAPGGVFAKRGPGPWGSPACLRPAGPTSG